MPFFDNTRKPTGFGGKVMVAAMNLGHRALADWGLSFGPAAFQKALDCGCGGGANLKKLLKCCPAAMSPERTIPPSAWKNPKR